jgi:hypothetical protein
MDANRTSAIGSLGSESASAAAAEAGRAAVAAWHTVGAVEAARYKPFEGRTPDAQRVLAGIERISADVAALEAFTAAVDAYDAAGYHNAGFVNSALNDFDKLFVLNLGSFPALGDPIDPSPAGPLGAL